MVINHQPKTFVLSGDHTDLVFLIDPLPTDCDIYPYLNMYFNELYTVHWTKCMLVFNCIPFKLLHVSDKLSSLGLLSVSLCSSSTHPTTTHRHPPLRPTSRVILMDTSFAQRVPWSLSGRQRWFCSLQSPACPGPSEPCGLHPPVMTRCGLALEVCANREQVGNLS